jgi:hypothetical protein
MIRSGGRAPTSEAATAEVSIHSTAVAIVPVKHMMAIEVATSALVRSTEPRSDGFDTQAPTSNHVAGAPAATVASRRAALDATSCT